MKNAKFFVMPILLSVALTVLLVGILAFFVKIFALDSQVIRLVNQLIKIIACTLGLALFLKQKGMLLGAAFGLIYSVITGLLFMVIGKSGASFLSFILDGVFCALIGGILGVLVVNIKNAR